MNCSKCETHILMDRENDGYRCVQCNNVFCKEHAEQHFGGNQKRAEEAERKLAELTQGRTV